VAALLLCAAPASVQAHKRGQHQPATATQAAAADTSSAPSEVAVSTGAVAADTGEAEPEPFVMPPMGDALIEHPHNKLVHFPVALSLAAAILLVAGRRRPGLEAAARALIWLAAAGAVGAYFTGRLQEEAFEGEPKEWLVEVHEKWGLATAVAIVLWAAVATWPPSRKFGWLVGLFVVVLVAVAAFYGGMVAHGE
jgi:uncharacterized membrane protein